MEQALALVKAKDVDRGVGGEHLQTTFSLGFLPFSSIKSIFSLQRALCVQFFDALGHAHPETVKGRRALSNLLFV